MVFPRQDVEFPERLLDGAHSPALWMAYLKNNGKRSSVGEKPEARKQTGTEHYTTARSHPCRNVIYHLLTTANNR